VSVLVGVAQPSTQGAYPVPAGRGRWRLTVHRRQFADTNWQNTIVGEFTGARTRKLVQSWHLPAVLTFTLDGQAPAAAQFTELESDVIAWRWDDTVGQDVAVFRGVIDASEDQLDEQSHIVNVSATDYLALLGRRFETGLSSTITGTPDGIANAILSAALNVATSGSGFSFGAGGYLPLDCAYVNPDGSARAAGAGQAQQTRAYLGNQVWLTALDELAKSSPGGFDYDVAPLTYGAGVADSLRIFWPAQGVTRAAPVLEYGSTVSRVQRQVTSADYGNYWRELGNNQSSLTSQAQTIGEAWNADASGQVVGLWGSPDNAASITDPVALAAVAQGNLNRYGVLIPVYTLTLRPDFYHWGLFHMGDVVPLVIWHGRLHVNTTVRVLGITYNIGDDGQEDVDVVVGRPDTTLVDVLGAVVADVNALARR
jgi:hypothetical protein